MSEGTARIVACPNCGRAAKWTTRNPFRPFCSERCKLIDLGEWASERQGDPETDAARNEQVTLEIGAPP